MIKQKVVFDTYLHHLICNRYLGQFESILYRQRCRWGISLYVLLFHYYVILADNSCQFHQFQSEGETPTNCRIVHNEDECSSKNE